MRWILDRLKEKSTYKGLTLLAALAGFSISPDAQAALSSAADQIAAVAPQIASATAACIGVYNVFRNERK